MIATGLFIYPGETDPLYSFQLPKLIYNPFLSKAGLCLSRRFVIHLQQFLGTAQTHVHFVGRPLELEYGGFSPLLEQAISGIEKSYDPHAYQQRCHGKQQKEHKALL
jgi:hypothetical protein